MLIFLGGKCFDDEEKETEGILNGFWCPNDEKMRRYDAWLVRMAPKDALVYGLVLKMAFGFSRQNMSSSEARADLFHQLEQSCCVCDALASFALSFGFKSAK